MTSHAERVLLGRLGAYTAHFRHDGHEVTRAARAAFESKCERDVDPYGVLSIEERLRRAGMARKAYYTRLALASVRARAKNAHPPDCLVADRAPGSVLAVACWL